MRPMQLPPPDDLLRLLADRPKVTSIIREVIDYEIEHEDHEDPVNILRTDPERGLVLDIVSTEVLHP